MRSPCQDKETVIRRGVCVFVRELFWKKKTMFLQLFVFSDLIFGRLISWLPGPFQRALSAIFPCKITPQPSQLLFPSMVAAPHPLKWLPASLCCSSFCSPTSTPLFLFEVRKWEEQQRGEEWWARESRFSTPSFSSPLHFLFCSFLLFVFESEREE